MARKRVILNADEYMARIREQRLNSVNKYRIKKKELMIATSNCVQNSDKTYIDNGDFAIYLKNASKYSQITITTKSLTKQDIKKWIESFEFTKSKKRVRVQLNSETLVIENVLLIDINDFCTALVIHMRRMIARTQIDS